MIVMLISAISGIWLMVAPAVLQGDPVASDNEHIVGPLIATFSIVAMSECTRNIRFLNIPAGLWLIVSPVILGYLNTVITLQDIFIGVLTLSLTFVRRKRKNSYAGGWAALLKN